MQARSRRIRDEILGFFRYSSKPAVLNPSPCKRINFKIISFTYLEQAFYLIFRVCMVKVEVIQETETDRLSLLYPDRARFKFL